MEIGGGQVQTWCKIGPSLLDGPALLKWRGDNREPERQERVRLLEEAPLPLPRPSFLGSTSIPLSRLTWNHLPGLSLGSSGHGAKQPFKMHTACTSRTAMPASSSGLQIDSSAVTVACASSILVLNESARALDLKEQTCTRSRVKEAEL